METLQNLTDLTVMAFSQCELDDIPDREPKRNQRRVSAPGQENTDLNEMSMVTQNNERKISKEKEMLKQNKFDMLGMKNTVSRIKNIMGILNNRTIKERTEHLDLT